MNLFPLSQQQQKQIHKKPILHISRNEVPVKKDNKDAWRFQYVDHKRGKKFSLAKNIMVKEEKELFYNIMKELLHNHS